MSVQRVMLQELRDHWLFLSGFCLESLSPSMEVAHAGKFLVALLDSPEHLEVSVM
jgi:hypothetical protein